jgi:hypothetical protein
VVAVRQLGGRPVWHRPPARVIVPGPGSPLIGVAATPARFLDESPRREGSVMSKDSRPTEPTVVNIGSDVDGVRLRRRRALVAFWVL